MRNTTRVRGCMSQHRKMNTRVKSSFDVIIRKQSAVDSYLSQFSERDLCGNEAPGYLTTYHFPRPSNRLAINGKRETSAIVERQREKRNGARRNCSRGVFMRGEQGQLLETCQGERTRFFLDFFTELNFAGGN